jgi:ABC-type polysaccharide/polyol phosphate export permease
VFYSSELFGPWRDWILLNPVAPLLEGLEQAVDKGRMPDLAWTAYSAVLATLIFTGAWLMFHRLEPSFADNV